MNASPAPHLTPSKAAETSPQTRSAPRVDTEELRQKRGQDPVFGAVEHLDDKLHMPDFPRDSANSAQRCAVARLHAFFLR